MAMRITSTNYTKANEDVTNIIGCTALPHNANIHTDRHNYVTGGFCCTIVQQMSVSY